MIYYGTKLSDNISVRKPEGFLICKSVPIARTGPQEYLASELGLPGDGSVRVMVYRLPEDVFSREAMASFEGMPFTDGHPEDEVTADNCRLYQRGHVQNVRRSGMELMADIIVTDPDVIRQVQEGKREISCGYQFDLDRQDGKYTQRNIRGNHVALVDQGRAGHLVCIKDSKPEQDGRRKDGMSKMNGRQNWLGRMFSSFARDEDVTKEEVAAAADALVGGNQEEAPTAAAPAAAPAIPGSAPEKEQTGTDQAEVDKQDRIIQLLEMLVAQKSVDQVPEHDPLEKLVQDVEGTPEKEEAPAESTFPGDPEPYMVDPEVINQEDEAVPEEEEEQKPVAADAAMVRRAVDAIKPIIAQLPVEKRKKAADEAVCVLRGGLQKGGNGYAAILKAKRGNDAKPQPMDAGSLGRKIMEKRNCNFNK